MQPRNRRCRSEEHTSELQSPCNLVCRLLLEKKKKKKTSQPTKDTHQSTHHGRVSRVRSSGFPHVLSVLCWLTVSVYFFFFFFFFFFNDTATTEIYTLSLHDALPI